MNEEVSAAERLERSLDRLEQAVADRISTAGASAAERVEALESANESLKSRLNVAQTEQGALARALAEKDALARALEDANAEYRVLENAADTVRDRLDETIGRLREVLSA